jgi:23S rRNA (adenine-N6)-dimethyltransferase
MTVCKRKIFAQNFINRSSLVDSLLNMTSIGPDDIVYEIGPGAGMLTKGLAKRSGMVIAIEKDTDLYMSLVQKFGHNDNVILHDADFLRFDIRDSCYKIVANLPFNITSAVMRKIIHAANTPIEAYLIMQKEAAEKFTGMPRTTQFSVLVKPWFRLRIIKYFKNTDFSPVPKVDVVMLYMKKRSPPLIATKERHAYERFIARGFNAWKKNVKQNYKNMFTYTQWKRLSRDLAFPIHAKPSELHFRQWLGLFEFFKKRTSFGVRSGNTTYQNRQLILLLEI